MIGGDLKRHVRKDASVHDGIHGGFGYSVRNLKGQRILEMGHLLRNVIVNSYHPH